MRYIKTLGIILVLCLFLLNVFVSCTKIENTADNKNFSKLAIDQFIENRDKFEKVKNDLIEIQMDVNISYESDKIIIKDMKYQNVKIDEELTKDLLQIFEKFSSMNIYYNSGKGIIKFEIVGTVKPKGIVYLKNTNEGELQETLVNMFDKNIFIEQNWYYYEEMAHT